MPNAGLPFDAGTEVSFAWAPEPEPPQVTWFEHAVDFVDMKWPQRAAPSRISIAGGLATVTPSLVRGSSCAPSAQVLRSALCGWAFNTNLRQTAEPLPEIQTVLDWISAASLPVADLNDLAHIRRALQTLRRRMDGKPVALNTLVRKLAVFHAAFGYAVVRGLLPSNPLDRVKGNAAS